MQGTGFNPWSGTVPHAMQQLRRVPQSLKPDCLGLHAALRSPVLQRLRPARLEP